MENLNTYNLKTQIVSIFNSLERRCAPKNVETINCKAHSKRNDSKESSTFHGRLTDTLYAMILEEEIKEEIEVKQLISDTQAEFSK